MLWHDLEERSTVAQLAVRLVLATGLRIGEVLSARGNDVERYTRFIEAYQNWVDESSNDGPVVSVGLDQGSVAYSDPHSRLLLLDFENWLGLWAGSHHQKVDPQVALCELIGS